MTRIKLHISNVKLPFYPPCEVKCRLQNGVSTESYIGGFIDPAGWRQWFDDGDDNDDDQG